MSSNPFRKKALEAIDTARAQSPAKSSLRSNSPPAADDDACDAGNPRRPKPVKKVRVMSPPPLSPDSPEWPAAPAGARHGYNYSYPSEMPEARPGDPFNGAASTDESDRDAGATPPPPLPPPAALRRGAGQTPTPPANPFSRTLQDLESSKDLETQRKNEGEALKAANAARQSLNVDAFRRLLMTGKASDVESLPAQQDLSAGVDSATSSKSPATDYEESSDSPDSSADDNDDDVIDGDDFDDDGALMSKLNSGQQQTGKEKKAPPPPPSSRHGRSLRKAEDDNDVPRLGPTKDVNKPLPPSPIRRSTDDAESPFDRESAGKVPELESAEADFHSAPAAKLSSSSSSSIKKSAPAPPPRRGHSKSESKSQIPAIPNADEFQQQTPARARGDDRPARTSADEARPRPDIARQAGPAPAPPPPRRPNTFPRQTSHVSSPLGGSSSYLPQSPPSSKYEHEYDHHHPAILDALTSSPAFDASPASNAKLSSRPPPPPARNPSVRRPPSVSSVEGVSRRISGESRRVSGEGRSARDGVPPPPPRRQRGSSPSSIDTPGRRSAEDASRPSLHGPGVYDGAAPGTPDAGQGVDILADLDALQREVDALRGKLR